MIEIYDDVFDSNIQDHIEEYILNSKKKEPSWYFEKSTCAVGYKNHRCVEESPQIVSCLLYTSPSPRDLSTSRMPSSA